MADSKAHIISTLFLIFFCVSRVTSLMCYVCNTKTEGQEDCLEISDGSEKYLTNCTAPWNQSCRSILGYIDYVKEDQSRDMNMIRQCATYPHNPEKPCYHRTGQKGRITVCTCEGEACNGAPERPINIMTALLCLLIMVLVTKI